MGARASELLATNRFVSFPISTWRVNLSIGSRPANAPATVAERVAREATLKSPDEKIDRARTLAQWTTCLVQCGNVIRPGARDGKAPRLHVLARTYTLATAAQRLKLPLPVVKAAVHNKALLSFTDPQEIVRLPAAAVEAVNRNDESWEQIAAFVPMRIQHIALVSGLSDSTIRRRLEKAGLSRVKPLWGQVRSLWGLPNSLRQFEEIQKERQQMLLATPASTARQYRLSQQEALRLARAELRQRLLAVFPSWGGGESRDQQQVFLHIGPE